MEILVADHQPFFRAGFLTAIADTQPNANYFEATTKDELVRTLNTHQFDYLFIDKEMCDQGGVSMIKGFRQQFSHLSIIVTSATEDLPMLNRLCTTGIRGVVNKTAPIDICMQALKLIFAGGIYMPEYLLKYTLLEHNQTHSKLKNLLTPRQEDILSMLEKGCSNKEIGRHLCLAEGTIKTHMATLFKVLGVRNRTQAASQSRLV